MKAEDCSTVKIIAAYVINVRIKIVLTLPNTDMAAGVGEGINC